MRMTRNRLYATVAGIGLALAATLLVACGDDDDAAPTTGTGSSTAVVEATDTPTPSGGAPTSESGGAVGGSSGPAIPPSGPGLPDTDQPPVTTASANGESVEMGIGTFCWTRLCVDKIGVPTRGTLTVTRGDVVSVAIPEGLELNEAGSTVFEATEPQELDDGGQIWPYPGNPGENIGNKVTDEAVEVPIDLDPGQYVLSVGMYFDGGDVIYGVLLNVQ